MVLGAAAAAAAAYAAGGWFTVAEGIVYPFMIDLFADRSAPLGVRMHYAVLRAPVDVVHRRVHERRAEPAHADALSDAAVVEDLWSQFERVGVAERHRVDVDLAAPDEVAAEIDRRMRSGVLRLEEDSTA